MLLLDHAGTVLLREDTPDDAPMLMPEIDRTDLRDLLLDSLPEGTVRWGRGLEAAEPLGDGRHLLRLTDGTTVESDLLIAAELALAITAHPGDFDSAVAEYEPAMRDRARSKAEFSTSIMEMMTADDAAQNMLRFFRGEDQ
jgi:hypothetical protein